MHTFKQGPKLLVHVKKEIEILKIKLSFHPNFSVEFSSEISNDLQDKIKQWLESYSYGKTKEIDFLPRQNLPTFTKKVLTALAAVPFGKVITYSNLASLAGCKTASRAVGTICRKNLFPLLIPCHRVIRSNGHIGNFAFGLSLKEALLEFEQTIRK
jgi:O-6-methylguanine DNA methyltransferase